MSTATNYPSPQPDLTQYDRLKELKQFDESKIGVKGLVDRGLSTIPRFFIHPTKLERVVPDDLTTTKTRPPIIPVIDFSSPRQALVEQVHDAAKSLGFFQVINHAVPLQTITDLLNAIRAFNELPEDEKMHFYTRDISHGSAFSTNFDLYQSQAASWRDTLQMRLGPTPPSWDHVHDACRDAVVKWDAEVVRFGEEVLGLLCEGLGLGGGALREVGCLEWRVMAAHYYPFCPQPELTAGLTPHTDPGVVTVLVQNGVPGLQQVEVAGEWVDVEPLEGGIVVNIGDILQIMSNDEYKSVQHRVLANALQEPRVAVAVFFNSSLRENLFGPLPGLVSPEKPARYRQFTLKDYLARFFSKELDGKTLTDYYRV